MIPKLFYPGQEVVCITDQFNAARPELNGLPQPKKDSIYTVLQYVWFRHDMWFLSLVEIDEDVLFSEDGFAPVADISELMEVDALENCEVTINWLSDILDRKLSPILEHLKVIKSDVKEIKQKLYESYGTSN